MRSRGPLILAHRGDAGHARENTLASFRDALETGADGVEFDVRRARDGLVVHHDAMFRLGGKRRSLAGVARRALPTWIPRLEDVCVWAEGHRGQLDVEIKESGDEERILEALRPVRQRCTFTSFLPDVVYRVRQLEPRARVGWITKGESQSVEEITRELRPTLVVLPLRRCSERLVAALECEVWAWNVNTETSAERLQAWGVSAFITDDPRRLVAWRQGRSPPRRGLRTDRRES